MLKHIYLIPAALTLANFVLMMFVVGNLTFRLAWAFLMIGLVMFLTSLLMKSWAKSKRTKTVTLQFASIVVTFLIVVPSLELFSFILLTLVRNLPYSDIAVLFEHGFYGSILAFFGIVGLDMYVTDASRKVRN